jgi:pantoate--beta-alanine ligase
MHLVNTIRDLQSLLSTYKKQNKTIGFTPTMGALHKGHISLIQNSIDDTDISVCSIFVNPTQFNQTTDLKKYPRNLDADAKLLKGAGLSILFFPSVEEIYPPDLDTTVDLDFEGLDEKMEGEFRPGHFKGVAQVVNRLLDIIKPDKIFMGQKDFQQFSIVGYMIRKLRLKTELVVCPTARESHGLAMSSRNERLTAENRQKASVINKTLLWVKENINEIKVSELERQALINLTLPDFRPEYFEIINGATLKSLRYVGKCKYVVACTAVWAGDVRLIDNMILRDER